MLPKKKVQYGGVRLYRFLKVPQRFVKLCKVLVVSVRFSKVRYDSIRFCEVLRGLKNHPVSNRFYKVLNDAPKFSKDCELFATMHYGELNVAQVR